MRKKPIIIISIIFVLIIITLTTLIIIRKPSVVCTTSSDCVDYDCHEYNRKLGAVMAGYMPICDKNECKCEYFNLCSDDSHCGNVDCSYLDKPGLKEGYKAYCIEEKCECKCYDCE
jgi:hypothetical protein